MAASGRPLARALVPAIAIAALALQLGIQRRFWRCPIALVVRQPCPTCGISRATWELLHLHFRQAWSEHPLVFLVVPYVALLATWETYRWVRYGELGSFMKHRAARIVGMTLAVLLFLVWIARFFGAFGGKVLV